MHQGQLVFSQLMRHLPLTTFHRYVARYAGEHKVKSFSCLDQYLCMAFAQLTYRESLRDIESSLRAPAAKLYHLGIRGNVSRNTLANRQEAAESAAVAMKIHKYSASSSASKCLWMSYFRKSIPTKIRPKHITR